MKYLPTTSEDFVPVNIMDAGRGQQKVSPRPKLISAPELCATTFEPIKFVVSGYIAEGCTLFAGAPKLGKSWFCLDIALAVAGGGYCLGTVPCEEGDVLYLALEDNERRLQSRINRLWELEARVEAKVPARLQLATEWPRANEGGVDEIRHWISTHPDARLVIVDVLAMFKASTGGKDQTQYEADYKAVKDLQKLASDTGVAIVIVHHTRKGSGDIDPFESISGTLGLSGAADTGLVLRRDANGVTLYGRGRDIEEIETAVEFDKLSCKWIAHGAASEVRRTDERTAILATLLDADDLMTPGDLAVATGTTRNNIDQLLFKMAKAGEVNKVRRGYYRHPDRTDLIEDQTSNPDKIDKKIRNVSLGHETPSLSDGWGIEDG